MRLNIHAARTPKVNLVGKWHGVEWTSLFHRQEPEWFAPD